MAKTASTRREQTRHRAHTIRTRRRAVSWLLVIALLLRMPAPSRAERTPPGDLPRLRRVPILMYHYVSTPPPEADRYRLDLSVTPRQFAEQLAWLRANDFTTITLDDLYAALMTGASLPDRPVILTFDDGYADAYEHAFPLLVEFDMTGTFFVITETLDAAQPGYLTWDQARVMAEAGMSIQSHSRSHPDLTDNCNYDCLVWQILGSVETIEAHLGQRPRFFSYPGGRYDRAVLALLPQVGIQAAVTTRSGTLHTSARPLELKRARVRGTTTLTDFAWMLLDWTK